MANKTKIEWTQSTWNPVTGCSKISSGCQHCYAERMAKRLQAMGVKRYANAFTVTLHEDLLTLPLQWKQPRLIFVNSMSDLFHEDIPTSFIQNVFETMYQCPQHIFQVLTKRSQRMHAVAHKLQWTNNIWLGVSVENNQTIERIHHLQNIHTAIRFISCEPLLESIPHLPLANIHWVIVGGESGFGARVMQKEWVECIFNQCQEANVPFFFKQWGGVRKAQAGRLLHQRTYSEMPLMPIPIL